MTQFNDAQMGHLAIEVIYIDGFKQKRRNSIANALELRVSCTSPSICDFWRLGICNPPINKLQLKYFDSEYSSFIKDHS